MDKSKLKILVFGCGAIGSHLTYCLASNKTKIYTICRNEHYKAIKKNGLKLSIFQNDLLKKKTILKDSKNIIFFLYLWRYKLSNSVISFFFKIFVNHQYGNSVQGGINAVSLFANFNIFCISFFLTSFNFIVIKM